MFSLLIGWSSSRPISVRPISARAGAGLVELGVAQQVVVGLAVQPRSPLALDCGAGAVALSASLLRAVTPVTARRERCAYGTRVKRGWAARSL